MLAATEHDWLVLKSSGPFRRERCFISTLPTGGRSKAAPRRRLATIFEKGWHRKSEARQEVPGCPSG
eukprot:12887102-Alexandrium_andersonii.AAC.1